MTRPWEIERDRFGLMFSFPLEVGEAIKVVPAERAERAEAVARDFAEALENIANHEPGWRVGDPPWKHWKQLARDALGVHPSYALSEAERTGGAGVTELPDPRAKAMTSECDHPVYHPGEPHTVVGWDEWAERMGETHQQERCPHCGRWVVWTPLSEAERDGGQG